MFATLYGGMKRGFGALAAALCLLTAPPAFAHHSHPLIYDWCKSITVEGRVESGEYKNPHSIIVVTQDDGTAYTVDWLPLDGLTRNRILESAKSALTVGARVSATGAPSEPPPRSEGSSPTSRAR